MRPLFMLVALALGAGDKSALPLQPGWEETNTLKSEHANQAAAADEKFVYAVSNTTVARYDRTTGKFLGSGTTSDTKHLNSAFIYNGKVYCAHSNYPKKPEESDIRVYDPQTDKLTVFHTFNDSPGSIVWCIHDGKRWWCCFAHYGATNAKTNLIRYDEGEGWKESARWTFPKKVVDDWDGMSASGGLFDGDTLLVTHHHFKVLYRLKIPKEPGELEFIEALSCPFPGQGIAHDPKTKGLVGINRDKKMVVFAVKKR
jgi:hypothetical protein